jgi:hypothetical protein
MKNLYVLLLIVLAIVVLAYIFNSRRRKPQPSYVALLRDDLYFYPPRFPIPRPHLRHHEIPHRGHFGHHR